MEMTGGSVMNTANSKVQNSCRETPANNRKYNTYILIIFSLYHHSLTFSQIIDYNL